MDDILLNGKMKLKDIILNAIGQDEELTFKEIADRIDESEYFVFYACQALEKRGLVTIFKKRIADSGRHQFGKFVRKISIPSMTEKTANIPA